MFAFMAENLGTIVVAALLAVIVAAIVIKMARDKQKGKCVGCSCGCDSCPQASSPMGPH